MSSAIWFENVHNVQQPSRALHIHSPTHPHPTHSFISSSPRYEAMTSPQRCIGAKTSRSVLGEIIFSSSPCSPLALQLALWWLRQHSKAPRRSAWRAVAPCKRQRRWVISRESPRRSTYILKSIVSRLWAPEVLAWRFTSNSDRIKCNFNIFHSQITSTRRLFIKILEIASLTTLKLK